MANTNEKDKEYEEIRKMVKYFNKVEKIEVPKIFTRPLDIKEYIANFSFNYSQINLKKNDLINKEKVNKYFLSFNSFEEAITRFVVYFDFYTFSDNFLIFYDIIMTIKWYFKEPEEKLRILEILKTDSDKFIPNKHYFDVGTLNVIFENYSESIPKDMLMAIEVFIKKLKK